MYYYATYISTTNTHFSGPLLKNGAYLKIVCRRVFLTYFVKIEHHRSKGHILTMGKGWFVWFAVYFQLCTVQHTHVVHGHGADDDGEPDLTCCE